MEQITKQEIMPIVKNICSMRTTDCRSLNKSQLCKKLMKFANIPDDAKIMEIPLDWDNMVNVLFIRENDFNYYSLFAGIGIDNEFHFDLSITGTYTVEGESYFFDFYDDEEEIPINYFLDFSDLDTIEWYSLEEVEPYIQKEDSPRGIKLPTLGEIIDIVIDNNTVSFLLEFDLSEGKVSAWYTLNDLKGG